MDKLGKLRKPAKDHNILATYMICANHRSGSGLLGAGLGSTSIAGSPGGEFFQYRAFKNRNPDKPFLEDLSTLRDYLSDLYQETKTDNGVFGFKIMWTGFNTLMNKINQMGINTRNRREVLERIFPNLKYIYIYRQDKLRQAISLVRANQSQVWYIQQGSRQKQDKSNLKYDGHQITSDLLEHVILNDLRWQQFFEEYGISPLMICYEKFSDDYSGHIIKTLEYLNYSDKENVLIGDPPYEKTRDKLTEQWVERYLNENPWLADNTVRNELYINNNFGLAMASFQKHNQDPELGELSKIIQEQIAEPGR